jgi:hypothetical protein
VAGLLYIFFFIAEVHEWLEPLLRVPVRPFELYTAPPRTVLAESATLLDLQLCPAALVHFASRVTNGDTDYLHEDWLDQVFKFVISKVVPVPVPVKQLCTGGCVDFQLLRYLSERVSHLQI